MAEEVELASEVSPTTRRKVAERPIRVVLAPSASRTLDRVMLMEMMLEQVG